MTVTTSRTLATVVSLAVAIASYAAARWASSDPELQALIAAAGALIGGLFVPAAGAPVGTVDALSNPAGDPEGNA